MIAAATRDAPDRHGEVLGWASARRLPLLPAPLRRRGAR
jgi:hypothetical protein